MPGVILVRHAIPEVRRGVASKLWGLGESAREDCVLLAHALPHDLAPTVWSSDERKARETADVLALRLGLEVRTDPRFAEVDRPQIWDRDYREVAAAYLAGVVEPEWESPETVRTRFGAAITEALSAAAGRDVLVVNHGLAMSLWAASVVPLDITEWWRALTFPDAWRIDPEAGSATHLWLGGREGT